MPPPQVMTEKSILAHTPVLPEKLYFSTVSWYPYKAHAIQACGCTGSGCGLRAAKKNV